MCVYWYKFCFCKNRLMLPSLKCELVFLRPRHFVCPCFYCMRLFWFLIFLQMLIYCLCCLSSLILLTIFRRYCFIRNLTPFILFITILACSLAIFFLIMFCFLFISFVYHFLKLRIEFQWFYSFLLCFLGMVSHT